MTDDDHQRRLEAQSDEQLAASGQQVSMQAAMDKQAKKLENPFFLNELRDPDLDDSEVIDWLEDEYPTWFSGAHAVANRGRRWDEQADLKMMAKRERVYTEANPGRLLEHRPFLLATAQGAASPDKDAYERLRVPEPQEGWRTRLASEGISSEYREPMTSAERRAVYGAAEVAADLMALSREGAGLDATTTATTETNVRRQSEEDSTASKAGVLFE